MSHLAFKGKFLFTTPKRLEGMSDLAYTSMLLSALSGRLALEERTVVCHPGGRAENVAEHSCMLSLIAPVIAELYYPELDANLAARFATIHDAVEAYVGDTATHNIDEAGLLSKAEREKLGLQQLLIDYQSLPTFTKIIQDYEAQIVPEARMVRVLDKLMPLLVHFGENGVALRKHLTAPDLAQNAALRVRQLRQEYPEFERLIATRDELAELAVRHLLNS